VKFALLSESELRLVDLMFDADVFRELPTVVPPSAERGPAGSWIRSLIAVAPQIEATARRMGGVVEHASIDELLHIAEQGRDERWQGGKLRK